MRKIVWLVLSVALTACTSTIPADVLKELKEDKASLCGYVQTPYGGTGFGRAGDVGTRVTVTAGQCMIERTTQ